MGIRLGLRGLLLWVRPGLDLFNLLALRTGPQDLAYLEVGVTQGLNERDGKETQILNIVPTGFQA